VELVRSVVAGDLSSAVSSVPQAVRVSPDPLVITSFGAWLQSDARKFRAQKAGRLICDAHLDRNALGLAWHGEWASTDCVPRWLDARTPCTSSSAGFNRPPASPWNRITAVLLVAGAPAVLLNKVRFELDDKYQCGCSNGPAKLRLDNQTPRCSPAKRPRFIVSTKNA
jgi:hypothetical protein